MTHARSLIAASILALAATACSTGSEPEATAASIAPYVGLNPQLVAPDTSVFPKVNVAEAKGWPAGKQPVAAEGLKVDAYSRGLAHPRWMLVLPNGDVLVAESDSPGTDKTGGTIKGTIQEQLMKKAGSSQGSANRIRILRDADGDGVAEGTAILIDHDLMSPFGMAVVGKELFVANADALVAFPFEAGQVKITAKPRVVAALPAGYNHHWTKSLLPSADGTKLYVGVGSNSNIGENGLEMEKDRAAVWEIDARTGATRVYASGLRNPVGLAWNPATNALWAVVNERDELGNNLVPDYLTSVTPGAFYGWPWSYWGGNVDTRVKPPRPDMVAKAIRPDYSLGPHVAPIGLTFATGAKLGGQFGDGAFVGMHGSWNREPWTGYQVAFVPFAGGKPTGAAPVPVLSGFRVGSVAYGRPAGVAIARDGSLLVADDVGGTIWRVSAR